MPKFLTTIFQKKYNEQLLIKNANLESQLQRIDDSNRAHVETLKTALEEKVFFKYFVMPKFLTTIFQKKYNEQLRIKNEYLEMQSEDYRAQLLRLHEVRILDY
jgi:hypothetical protein